MAYCRFSCDGFRSNVYVYEGDDPHDFFITVHVADSMYLMCKDAPEIVTSGSNTEMYESMLAMSSYLKDRPRIVIHKQHAGKRYHFDTILGVVDFLRELQRLGYHVPTHAFERLEHDRLSQVATNRHVAT
jgi:hypothetical protein